MKKTLMALATAAFTTLSFAQSSNTVTTNMKTNTLDKIKENIGASLYTEYARDDFKTSTDSKADYLYNSLALKYKAFGGKFSAALRTQSYATATDQDGKTRNTHEIINPRIGFSRVFTLSKNTSFINSNTLEIGVNDAHDIKNRLVKIKEYNGISMNLNERNTLDLGIELYKWFYDGKSGDNDNTAALGVYGEAIHKYAFTDKVAFQSIFEIETAANTNGIYKRVANWSILKAGPEFSIGKNMSLYTAALFPLNQGESEVALKGTNLFIGFSALLL